MPESVSKESHLPLNQDQNSIYYIHPSDANSVQLVSFKFNGDGFTSWKRSILLTLSAKNKIGFVNGVIKTPVDETSDEFHAWSRCNDLVCSWLLFNLDESIAGSVMFKRSARDIWLDLEERFGYTSLAQIYALEQQLAEVTQGNQSVSEFFTSIKSLWDAIDEAHPLPYCTCNKCSCNLTKRLYERHQEKMVIQFMMKLSEQFATVRGNILMLKNLPKVTEAYRTFAQEEKHKEISHHASHNESMAFMADKRGSTDNFKPRNNSYRKSGGSKYTGSTSKSLKPGSKYYCTHCETPGHSIDRCFKIHGYPANFKGFKDKKVAALAASEHVDMDTDDAASPVLSLDQYNQLMQLLHSQKFVQSDTHTGHALMAGNYCLLSCSESTWLIDSGASDHICSDLSCFSDYTNFSDHNNYITIPDGSKVLVQHIGTVKINDDIILHNVLHVPQFQFNLISVHKLCTDLHCEVHFSHTQCFLFSQKGKKIPLGNVRAGLYNVQDQATGSFPPSHACTQHCLATVEDAKLWHLRLGHLPFSQIPIIQPSCNIKSCSKEFFCQVCPKAKQTRLPFPVSSIKTLKPFELIHIDVWGPHAVHTSSGCNQFLTIVDDYSRFTWIHFLKHKSDAVSIMTDFFQMVKTQFHSVVQCVRSDNAPELCEGAMKTLYTQLGILTQTSCSDTPQQNGIVLRKHKHLLETARSLYIQSKVPDNFWGFCVLCAVYLINRMPLKPINNDTPYFRLFGTIPSLDHLKTFGCLCYVYTSKVKRSKLAPRASPCVFIGYSNTQKGYKVFNLTTKQITITRNVKFHETHFPYHFLTQSLPSSYTHSIYLPTTSTSFFYDTAEPLPTSSLSSSPTPSNSPPLATTLPSSPISPLSPDSLLDITQIISPNPPVLRRSSRPTHPPLHLADYKCHTASSSPSPHWCNLVSYDAYPDSHKAFLSQTCDITEPFTYTEAASQPIWVDAMNLELQALQANHTWDLVSLPPGKKPIGSKWVFKVKLKANGDLERCKARLVAKGFNQKHGIDYEETFSPVVKMNTVRSLIAVAASKHWPLFQLDVNNAFLHGDLKEEVYMKVPEGMDNPDKLVCRLKKSLYGLKQASRQWHEKLAQSLHALGFSKSQHDHSLFIKKSGEDICIAAVYVDDIIVTGTNLSDIEELKSHLHHQFSIKDLGKLNYFLGIEVGYTSEGILLSQNKSLRSCSQVVSLTCLGKHLLLFL